VFNFIKQAETENLFYYQLKKEENILVQILAASYSLNLQSVIVEGGAKLLQSFIDEGIWDEARVICNEEMIIWDGLNAPVLKNNKLYEEQKIQNDTISFFSNEAINKI
jgi:diaminohydroxyphosphoribosylaminopyrimidine deaminase/5-amino-6-(5-phosphoribosylamino)uracil reductase